MYSNKNEINASIERKQAKQTQNCDNMIMIPEDVKVSQLILFILKLLSRQHLHIQYFIFTCVSVHHMNAIEIKDLNSSMAT